MNRNRLLIGVFIALVLAFLTSSYVYRKFKEASFVKPAARAPDNRGSSDASSAGYAPGCIEIARNPVAGG